MPKCFIGLAGLMILFGTSTTQPARGQSAILDINPDNISPYFGFHEAHGNGMVGWTFSLNQTETISQVGWYDYGQDGLSRNYKMGLWQGLSGSDLWQAFSTGSNPTQLLGTVSSPGITILGGTSAPLNGPYRVYNLPIPITLQPGNYELGGLDTATTTDAIQYVFSDMGGYQSSNPNLTIGAFFYAAGPGNDTVTSLQATYNSSFYLANGLELGPMLFVQNVPEPSVASLVLIGAVAGGMIGWCKRIKS